HLSVLNPPPHRAERSPRVAAHGSPPCLARPPHAGQARPTEWFSHDPANGGYDTCRFGYVATTGSAHAWFPYCRAGVTIVARPAALRWVTGWALWQVPRGVLRYVLIIEAITVAVVMATTVHVQVSAAEWVRFATLVGCALV